MTVQSPIQSFEKTLTRYELLVLERLRAAAGNLVSREALYAMLYPTLPQAHLRKSNTLQVFVSRLRKKLPKGCIVKSQRRGGYLLRIITCDICDERPYSRKLVTAAGIETRACSLCLIKVNPQELEENE